MIEAKARIKARKRITRAPERRQRKTVRFDFPRCYLTTMAIGLNSRIGNGIHPKNRFISLFFFFHRSHLQNQSDGRSNADQVKHRIEFALVSILTRDVNDRPPAEAELKDNISFISSLASPYQKSGDDRSETISRTLHFHFFSFVKSKSNAKEEERRGKTSFIVQRLTNRIEWKTEVIRRIVPNALKAETNVNRNAPKRRRSRDVFSPLLLSLSFLIWVFVWLEERNERIPPANEVGWFRCHSRRSLPRGNEHQADVFIRRRRLNFFPAPAPSFSVSFSMSKKINVCRFLLLVKYQSKAMNNARWTCLFVVNED